MVLPRLRAPRRHPKLARHQMEPVAAKRIDRLNAGRQDRLTRRSPIRSRRRQGEAHHSCVHERRPVAGRYGRWFTSSFSGTAALAFGPKTPPVEVIQQSDRHEENHHRPCHPRKCRGGLQGKVTPFCLASNSIPPAFGRRDGSRRSASPTICSRGRKEHSPVRRRIHPQQPIFPPWRHSGGFSC